jgi:hypothetical protein
MVNSGEALVNAVSDDKPKVLLEGRLMPYPPLGGFENGLGPKGTWSGCGVPNSPPADAAPPAKRRDLTHPRYTYGTW